MELHLNRELDSRMDTCLFLSTFPRLLCSLLNPLRLLPTRLYYRKKSWKRYSSELWVKRIGSWWKRVKGKLSILAVREWLYVFYSSSDLSYQDELIFRYRTYRLLSFGWHFKELVRARKLQFTMKWVHAVPLRHSLRLTQKADERYCLTCD